MQSGILARDMQKVDQFVIYQSIGRNAGWLTAASAAGKKTDADPPHIMCLPEKPFEKDKFLQDVKSCYDRFGWVSIACGEGITYADGRPVSASKAKDKFNNVEFGAMGGTSVAVNLHRMISDEFGFRGEFQITESLPMCAADRAVQLDIDEAYMCGQAAVNLVKAGRGGVMVTLEREPTSIYKCNTGTVPLQEVAIKAKPMPDEYINAEGNFVTDAFIDYLRPLVGELPQYTTLEMNKFCC
jgi:6-phosphofructokinase 1